MIGCMSMLAAQMSFALAWRFGLGMAVCLLLAWLVITYGGRE